MSDLDELVRRAVESPIAAPPDLDHVRARARRHRRHRVVTRVAAGVAVLGLTGGALAAVAGGGSDREVRVAGAAPQAQTPGGAITHPVLESCTPATAIEDTLTGSGITSPPLPGEVFADPARGVAGALAVLVREPAPAGGFGGKLPALAPNLTIAGQPANYGAAQPSSGIDWLLPDGSLASIRAKDVSEADLVALATEISVPTGSLPAHLTSIGTTAGEATRARSQCPSDRDRFGAVVEAIQGPVANRYAYVASAAPGLRWDVGDITYLVTTMPGETPTSPPPIRQATDAEWSELLAKTPKPPATSVTTTPPR
jgi:hypothetical protein